MKFQHLLCAASLVLAAASSLSAAAPAAPSVMAYPYGSPAFTRLISDSDHRTGGGSPTDFYQWMDQAPLAAKSHGLVDLAKAEKVRLSRLATPAQKTVEVRAFCTKLHHMVKTWIPKFSLNTGFEFTDAMNLGTRQCLLQSVLLSSILQRAGIDAGTVMVWRNLHGGTTNDGHAVCLVHLPDGKAVELDASDPVPFVTHQGLLAEDKGQRDVEPVFADGTPTITGFKATVNGNLLSVAQVQPLSYNFVRSQFFYYRGERAPGGFFSPKTTPDGLAAAARDLSAAIRLCPQNALAVYMLGHIYAKQGDLAAARRQVAESLQLYADAGWTPQGALDLKAEVAGPTRAASLPHHM